MPDLLASLQINSALPGLASVVPLRGVPVAAPGASLIAPDFAGALGALALPGAPAKSPGGRQDTAEPGNDLPVGDTDVESLIAWLPDGLVAVGPPVPATVPVPTFNAAPARPATVDIGAGAPTIPPFALPQAAPATTALTDGVAPPADLSIVEGVTPDTAVVVEFGEDVGLELTSDGKPALDMPATRGRFKPASREASQSAPALVALQPSPAAAAATTSGAAAQVFATALGAAPRPASSERGVEAAIQLQGQTRAEQLTTIQPMSDASQTPLDLTRDDWAGKMIDRIAALRDAAETADTRIRLAPENLGALEISIRRDGDRLHVHFAAENPAARQLIADAAPRLAELADARGVKLGQTSVDAGGGHGGQRAPDHPAGATLRNAAVATTAERTTDERIA